jgi:hypothetical protein
MTQPTPTILALIAQPLVNDAGQPQVRLDIEGEVRYIRQRLGDLRCAAELHVAIATPDNLLRLLTHRHFDVLHFSGHGGQDVLAFEDGRGGLYPLTPEQLQRLLLPGGQIPFHLAFLSACHSASLAEALAEAGVPHVVAIDCARPVLDVAATAFARAFYPALLSGRPLTEAFEIGCAAVNTDATLRRLGLRLNQKDLAALEEAKFLLLPQDGQHTTSLFSDLLPGELVYVAPQITPHNLVARPPTFTGREQELHTLANYMLDHRLTTVTGMGGMGKTELAREAGRWLAERCFFPQGITFVELRGLTEAVATRARIAAALQLPVERMVSDQALASALCGQERLLILDDLDEVVNYDRRGMRALLKTLLDHAAPLHLLLTSREAPRGLPEKLYPLLRLKPDEALRLFLTWAGLSRDDLPGTLDDLAAVLDFLDGYPLAIVLAAPLLAGYSLAELLRQLQQAQEQALADPTLSPEEQD